MGSTNSAEIHWRQIWYPCFRIGISRTGVETPLWWARSLWRFSGFNLWAISIQNSDDLLLGTDYIFHTLAARPSGELCLKYIFSLGAFARLPLAQRFAVTSLLGVPSFSIPRWLIIHSEDRSMIVSERKYFSFFWVCFSRKICDWVILSCLLQRSGLEGANELHLRYGGLDGLAWSPASSGADECTYRNHSGSSGEDLRMTPFNKLGFLRTGKAL